MYASIWRYLLVFIGLCTLINGFAIPPARGGALTSHPGAHADLDRRAPPSKKKPVGPNPQPAKPSANPVAQPGKPVKPSASNTSKTATSATPSPSPKPVKYPYELQSKEPIDVCDLSAFGCFEEDESSSVKLTQPAKPAQPRKSGKSVKRAPAAPALAAGPAPPTPYKASGPGDAREYNVKLKPNGLTLRSKPYWTSADLYNDKVTGLKLNKRYAKLKFSDPANKKAYEVSVIGNKPADVAFATEHILELQTVKKFIESVTQTEDEDNPKLIKLRQSIDSQWFIDHWNADHQAQVKSRPAPLPKYPRPTNPEDKSINDVVFEALGSKTNAENMILCDQTINSAKGRLWSNQNPANTDEVKKNFKLAAAGVIETNVPMKVINTVLAVYDYMKLKEVDDKLQGEINDVKLELGKDKLTHILGAANLPVDKTSKGPADLAAMWDEYMVRHVLRFKRKGVDWLLDQLTPALAAYKQELEALKAADKKIKDENAEDKRKKNEANKKAREKKLFDLERDSRALKRDLRWAAFDLYTEDQKFQNIKAKVDAKPEAQRKAERTALGFFKQVALKTKAAAAYFNLRIKVGQLDRNAVGFDETKLPDEIKQCTADVARIETVLTMVKKMDTDLKVEEATLSLGGIDVSP